jgi:hypothetical protein
VTVECLPNDLRGLDYDVTETGETERILPTAIIDKFVIGTSGELELATEGSTRPITTVVTHPGSSSRWSRRCTSPQRCRRDVRFTPR